jgi:hypothetical protein
VTGRISLKHADSRLAACISFTTGFARSLACPQPSVPVQIEDVTFYQFMHAPD